MVAAPAALLRLLLLFVLTRWLRFFIELADADPPNHTTFIKPSQIADNEQQHSVSAEQQNPKSTQLYVVVQESQG